MCRKSNNKQLVSLLGQTDMYLIDLVQKGYFKHPLTILDAGCGSGRNIPLFIHLDCEVTALDADEGVINRLQVALKGDKKTQKQLTVGVGEIGKLPQSDGVFDLVICNAVLHFSKDQSHFENMMKDMVRVLKKGGVLFARFVSSHTLEMEGKKPNEVMGLPDGSSRFIVDHHWFQEVLVPQLGLLFKEPFKTVNVANKRTMTTVVLVKE